MKQINRYIKRLALFATVVLLAGSLGACVDGVLDHLDPAECDYSVRILYHYNLENTSRENELEGYVKSLEVYLFDEWGILYDIIPVNADECTGEWVTERLLPPGRYSLIAVGNRTSMSRVHDKQEDPRIGVTRREELMLVLANRSQDATDDGVNYTSCGRLYHGYRTFTVVSDDISRVRVDMVHSHLLIHYKIIWEQEGITSADFTDLHVRMGNAPSEYNLMPEFFYPQPQELHRLHNPDADDVYTPVTLNCIHHIPTVHNNRNYVDFRYEATLFGQEATGTAVSYRLRNEPEGGRPTTFTVCDGDTPLANTVLLNDFFTRSGIRLDEALRQEYPLIFRINKDGSATVSFATVEDWEEGGKIKG